jgi:hypothetical protein
MISTKDLKGERRTFSECIYVERLIEITEFPSKYTRQPGRDADCVLSEFMSTVLPLHQCSRCAQNLHNGNYSSLDLGESGSETEVHFLSIHLVVTFQLEMKTF